MDGYSLDAVESENTLPGRIAFAGRRGEVFAATPPAVSPTAHWAGDPSQRPSASGRAASNTDTGRTEIRNWNVLATADLGNHGQAVAASDRDAAAPMLIKYLTVAESAKGATLLIAAAAGDAGVSVVSNKNTITETPTGVLF